MPDFSSLALFFAAASILLIVPGPAVIYIVTRSLDQGRMAGIVSTLGIGVGTLFHIIAAALGLSAILVSSVLAFNIVKYAGAVYLIYLGIQKFLSKEEIIFSNDHKNIKLSKIFYQGIIVNVLNPKTALFFFAFLPQFADSSRGNVTLQILILGILFILLGFITDGTYALLAGSFSKLIKRNTHLLRKQKYISGVIYFTLGVVAAVSGSNKK
jgi:threonine/homoserine/homoserine lactone efflux protein